MKALHGILIVLDLMVTAHEVVQTCCVGPVANVATIADGVTTQQSSDAAPEVPGAND